MKNLFRFNFISLFGKTILLFFLSIFSILSLLIFSLFYFSIKYDYESLYSRLATISIIIFVSIFPSSALFIVTKEYIRNNKIKRNKLLTQRTPFGGKDTDLIRKVTPPFSIRRISINNFEGIQSIDLELNPETSWVILTGDNASGKTAILRAILIGIIGKRDRKIVLA